MVGNVFCLWWVCESSAVLSHEIVSATYIQVAAVACIPFTVAVIKCCCFTSKRLLGRPERWVPDGLMFHPWCFFVQHPISEVPRPIATKPCHMIRIWLYFIMHVQKFGGRFPKNIGAKNLQNFRRLFATSHFDCEYLRNGLNIQTVMANFSRTIPSAF